RHTKEASSSASPGSSTCLPPKACRGVRAAASSPSSLSRLAARLEALGVAAVELRRKPGPRRREVRGRRQAPQNICVDAVRRARSKLRGADEVAELYGVVATRVLARRLVQLGRDEDHRLSNIGEFPARLAVDEAVADLRPAVEGHVSRRGRKRG